MENEDWFLSQNEEANRTENTDLGIIYGQFNEHLRKRFLLNSSEAFPKSMKKMLIRHAGNCLKKYPVAVKSCYLGFNLFRLGINQ